MSEPKKGPLLAGLRLKNFKAFKDSQLIQLKPLSILVGKNSAGKSSIIKAILACAQTASSNSDGKGLDLIGEFTNLGTFADTIHGGDVSDKFSITFEVPFGSEEQNYSFTYTYSNNDASPLAAPFAGVEASYDNQMICRGGKYSVNQPKRFNHRGGFKVTRAKLNKSKIFTGGLTMEPTKKDPFTTEFFENLDKLMKKHHGVDADEISGKNYDLFVNDFVISMENKNMRRESWTVTRQNEKWEQFGDTENASMNLDRRVLSRCRYIGPLREEPTREAKLAQGSGRDVGTKGEHLHFQLHDRKDDQLFMERFNGHLSALGIAESATTAVSFAKKGEGKESIETGYVMVMVNKDGTERSLMDLGFGTSQVMPILFELSLGKNRLILLEQPELHLHPAAQAELGDLLKSSLERGNQIIAETHSANLIERIRKLIRKGELSSDDANIIYIRQDSKGSAVCDSIGFNDDGTFSDTWPEDDFFGEREKEIFDW